MPPLHTASCSNEHVVRSVLPLQALAGNAAVSSWLSPAIGIQRSPTSDALKQTWKTGKGAFFEQLRHLTTRDPDVLAFIDSALSGDDLWLARNLEAWGVESRWPIHLRIEREMKGWADSRGKGEVFNILRADAAAHAGVGDLTASLRRVFGAGSDDLWLAQNLQAHGVESTWPIHLRIEREMKGWADSHGKGEVFNILRADAAAHAGDAALTASLRRVFGAGSDDLWLAQNLQVHGVESAWPFRLRMEREVKGWAGPVDLGALLAAIQAAPLADRQDAVNDTALRAQLSPPRLTPSQALSVMSALFEGSNVWKNPSANDFFRYFVVNKGTGTLPNSATMNCWESILYAAYLIKQINQSWIETFYMNAYSTGGDGNVLIWSQLGWSATLPRYPAQQPRAGQLLFYQTGGTYPGHVALAVGGGEAMSLWSQPNNTNFVQRIPITSLAGTVFIGDPPW
jgi:hypothetical protein